MMPFRSVSEQALIHSILFASYTLATLHNVTVDDAITTGAVVPQYQGSWNIGNTCTECLVRPDPSLAYNRTWHDITFSSGDGFTPTIEFLYTGSSVYIFFILANNVSSATTNTNVDFVLDGIHVGTYNHTPSNSLDYEYNVPVYVNNSVPQGSHSLVIQPVTSLGDGVNALVLFDYLIYTTDADTSSSVLPSVTSASTVSPTSCAHTQGTGSNIGAIAGGTVGGVVAVALVAAFLLCYWRQKGRNSIRPAAQGGDVVGPFMIVGEVASTPLAATIPSIYPAESPFTNTMSSNASTLTPQTSNPPTTTAPTTSAVASSNNNATLLEEVEILREEVVRLRQLRNEGRNDIDLPLDPPPQYSI